MSQSQVFPQPHQLNPSSYQGGPHGHEPRLNDENPSAELESAWRAIRQKLTRYLERAVISHFVDACEVTYEDQHIALEVPNANYYQGFVDRALPGLNKAKCDLGYEDVFFRIKVRPRGGRDEAQRPHGGLSLGLHAPSSITTLHTPRSKQGHVFTKISPQSGLDTAYTFDTFVRGPSNQFAHAVAQSVAASPGSHYNPLFIYGHCGLGKTHLLHAVGHEILRRSPETRVVFTTTDNFMSELIYCIRHSKQPHFKQKYGQCDVLLVDDIQFISGKKATQEEFFHVFNTLYERRKQIIITSDKYPKEISDIEERLRNRFEWGLISDIQAPDREHALAIVMAKAARLNVKVPQDAAEYIVEQWGRNIRELEGALRRLVAFAGFHGRPVDQAIAEQAFHSFTAKPGITQIRGESTGADYESVQKVVAHHFNVRASELCSNKRHRSIAYPRQIAFYLCREVLKASYPDIGKHFGGKNHTTVMHGVKRIAHTAQSDAELRLTLSLLKKELTGS